MEKRNNPNRLKVLELFPLQEEQASIKGLVLNESLNGFCIMVHQKELEGNRWIITNAGRYEARWKKTIDHNLTKIGLRKVS